MLSEEDRTRIFNAVNVDQGFMKEFVDDFIADLPADIALIAESLHAKDSAALERAAHGLKSVVGLFQAMACYELARNLETTAKNEDFEKASQIFAQLKDAITDLTEYLEASL